MLWLATRDPADALESRLRLEKAYPQHTHNCRLREVAQIKDVAALFRCDGPAQMYSGSDATLQGVRDIGPFLSDDSERLAVGNRHLACW